MTTKGWEVSVVGGDLYSTEAGDDHCSIGLKLVLI